MSGEGIGSAAGAPGEGVPAGSAPAGDAGGSTPPATRELAPEVLSVVNARVQADLEKVRAAERARVLAEVDEQRKRDTLSETDRLKGDLAAAKAEADRLTAAHKTAERRLAVTTAALSVGGVPEEYLTAAITRAGNDDSPEQIVKVAQERFAADLKRFGGGGGQPKPSGVPASGAPAAGDASISGMTETEIRTRAMKDKEWGKTVGRPELARRFAAAHGIQ